MNPAEDADGLRCRRVFSHLACYDQANTKCIGPGPGKLGGSEVLCNERGICQMYKIWGQELWGHLDPFLVSMIMRQMESINPHHYFGPEMNAVIIC